MAITKEKKRNLVQSYADMLKRNKAFIFASYSGLSVKEMQALRGKIREVDGEFHVVKNTLAKLALESVGMNDVAQTLEGPIAIGATADDFIGLAKAIVDVAREADSFEVRNAIIDGEPFDRAQIVMLAELPPLPVVQSQLLSVIQAPATRLVGVLSESVRQVARVVKAYADTQPAAA